MITAIRELGRYEVAARALARRDPADLERSMDDEDERLARMAVNFAAGVRLGRDDTWRLSRLEVCELLVAAAREGYFSR